MDRGSSGIVKMCAKERANEERQGSLKSEVRVGKSVLPGGLSHVEQRSCVTEEFYW